MGTLFLRSIPLAFVSLIPAYIIGEAWLGICLTVAIELVSPEVSPASISLFIFISNNISSVMPLLLPLLRDYYGLQRAMLILFPGLYVISAALFSVSLCLLLARDLCQNRDGVKLKSPGHLRQVSREKKRRRKAHRGLSEKSPLLSEKDPSLQESDSGSSDTSDCGIFEEIDEREQKEAQKAVSVSPDRRQLPIVVAASVNDREDMREGGQEAGGDVYSVDSRGGASVSVMSQPPRVQRRGRIESGRRGRGYGAVDIPPPGSPPRPVRCVGDKQPAPVVGSISEWSMLSPSEEEKRWLAESQEGI